MGDAPCAESLGREREDPPHDDRLWLEDPAGDVIALPVGVRTGTFSYPIRSAVSIAKRAVFATRSSAMSRASWRRPRSPSVARSAQNDVILAKVSRSTGGASGMPSTRVAWSPPASHHFAFSDSGTSECRGQRVWPLAFVAPPPHLFPDSRSF
jgi:hypothetical protein